MTRSKIMQSFVARIWLERSNDDVPQWRGHVQHIQGPEETYFQNLEQMSEFMEQVSGLDSLKFHVGRENVISMTKHSASASKKNDQDKCDD